MNLPFMPIRPFQDLTLNQNLKSIQSVMFRVCGHEFLDKFDSDNLEVNYFA